jgi:hypothetical protein
LGLSSGGYNSGVVMNRESSGHHCRELYGVFLPSSGPPKLIPSAGLKAPRPMVAAFDYNPRENSPNMDVEVRTLR